jgi:tetratricopeptide (TPR) repeat protein
MPDNPLEKFDYRIECDDFLIYDLGRLIEEDRASFDDEEFRRVIDAGIHEHIERRLDVRANMALRLRTGGAPRDRLLRTIEDIESPLRDIPEIIHSYTAYLFQRLEQCSEIKPDERITAAADGLLDSPGDRAVAESSIDFLGSIRSAVSARVLAHVISEPMLDEDLEMKAYNYVAQMWTLARHYILYSLKPHTHEDIPFRWFQLLVDCDEPSAVDRILEEVLVHGGQADYREDLLALTQLLERASDPELEDKVLQVLNSGQAPKATVGMLETFLKNIGTQRHKDTKADSPWARLDRAYAANRQYLAAATLFDAGKKSEAIRALDQLLQKDPDYPFALTLKRMM